MVKHCDKDLENLSIIKQALATMTFIAQHINDMKRKNEDAVHIQVRKKSCVATKIL